MYSLETWLETVAAIATGTTLALLITRSIR